MAAKKKSARAERRAGERASEALWRKREALAKLEPGGAPDRPIELVSASLVEPRALGLACLRCDALEARIDEHRAATLGGRTLRVVDLRCGRCGATRRLYLRVGSVLAN